jgi:cellulose biosynthesis protein BcsQ
MECLNIPEGLLRCLAIIKPWFDLATAILGLGTLTVIGLLVFFLRKQKAEIARGNAEYEKLRLDKQRVEETVRASDRDLGACRYQLKIYEKALLSGPDKDADLAKALQCIDRLEARFSSILQASSNGDAAFWSRPPRSEQRLHDYEDRLQKSIPILLFATQKGGVGKTTLTANIAACFADQGKRVLVVDLDYQGSISEQLILQGDLRLDDAQSRIDQLLLDTLDQRWPREILRAHARLHFIPAFYDLERLERQLEYRWAIEDTTDDARYRLARALLSDYVQQHYDIVLLDSPPRMTMGFINGFCTSTNLFVPTVIDFVSVPAVGRFAKAFHDLVPITNPRIKFSGIIGTLANRGPQIPAVNLEAASAAETRAQTVLGDDRPLFMRNAVMKRDVDVAGAAASGVAYWQKPWVQPIFKVICAEVENRL